MALDSLIGDRIFLKLTVEPGGMPQTNGAISQLASNQSMIFTIAHIQELSAVRFEFADRELLVEFAPTHPGNQRRTLQIRFGSEAARQLINAILAFDSTSNRPMQTLPIE